MPAQTHGRTLNGFNIFPKISGKTVNLECEKSFCCGPALQPLNMRPQGRKRGLCSFVRNTGRKRSLALGGIGSRSSATKRAITRRVENRNQMSPLYKPSAIQPRGTDVWPTKNATCINVKGKCACCLITLTKNHPRNMCLGSCNK